MRPPPLERVVLVFAIALAPAAAAQRATPDPFAPGTRVRVSLRDVHRQVPGTAGPSVQALRGTIVRATADTLVLDLRPGVAAVPRAGIAWMGVCRGMPSRFENGLRNVVSGALLGGMIGYLATEGGRSQQGWESVGEWATVGAGVSFVTGFIWPAERWRRVPRSAIVRPAGGGA